MLFYREIHPEGVKVGLRQEGRQLVTNSNCNQLKMQSKDGKYYKTTEEYFVSCWAIIGGLLTSSNAVLLIHF